MISENLLLRFGAGKLVREMDVLKRVVEFGDDGANSGIQDGGCRLGYFTEYLVLSRQSELLSTLTLRTEEILWKTRQSVYRKRSGKTAKNVKTF